MADSLLPGFPFKSAVPPLAGLVERIAEGKQLTSSSLLDEPTPAIVFLDASTMGGQVYMAINLYLYGD